MTLGSFLIKLQSPFRSSSSEELEWKAFSLPMLSILLGFRRLRGEFLLLATWKWNQSVQISLYGHCDDGFQQKQEHVIEAVWKLAHDQSSFAWRHKKGGSETRGLLGRAKLSWLDKILPELFHWSLHIELSPYLLPVFLFGLPVMHRCELIWSLSWKW